MRVRWQETFLNGDPRFVVGFRKGSGLIDCYHVQTHKDTFEELRDIARTAVSRMSDLRRRPYDYFGALEEDEYFVLDTKSIPTRLARKDSSKSTVRPTVPAVPALDGSKRPLEPGTRESAAVLQMVAQTDEHRPLTAKKLRSGLKLNFYMISFPLDVGYVGFIRRTGPHKSLKPGFKYFQYDDTLKRIDQPDFVLDERVDMIVAPDEVAVFSDTVIQVLFRDVGIVMGSVNSNVASMASTFNEFLPYTDEGTEALRRFGRRGPRNAKRIHDLVEFRLSNVTLDPEAIAQDLSNHGLRRLVIDGKLALTDASIPDYLDYLEGRLYHDDLTQDARRADRFSAR